jgi:hypothetical protein
MREPSAHGFHASLWLLSAGMYTSFCPHPTIYPNCLQHFADRPTKGHSARRLHIDPFGPFFNLFQTEKSPFSSTRADVTDLFPGGGVLKMRVPERPGPALNWSSSINRALAASRIKECTVSVSEFCQRQSASHNTGMEQPDFSNWFSKIFGNFQ